MRVTGSTVVVERTFFLMKSRAMADLCQYTLVSFTMMKETAVIMISGCVSESSDEWVITTHEMAGSILMKQDIIAVKHRAVHQWTYQSQCQSWQETGLLCDCGTSAKRDAPYCLI